MTTVTHLKTDTGRVASKQVVLASERGTRAFSSFDRIIAVTSPTRATLINRQHWDKNQTTLKYLKQFLGKPEDMPKAELRTYLEMQHFYWTDDEVLQALWKLEE